jgi:hypothetical protein
MLSVKRRAMGNGTFATLVFVRMNMHLLPNNMLANETDVNIRDLFMSLFEAVMDLEEDEDAAASAAARQRIGELLSGTRVAKSISDSGSKSGAEELNAEHLLDGLE